MGINKNLETKIEQVGKFELKKKSYFVMNQKGGLKKKIFTNSFIYYYFLMF